MENIELLEHVVRMQGVQNVQAQNIEMLTKTLNLVCQRIIALEACMKKASGVIDQQVEAIEMIMGNTTLPKNKTKGRVIPISLVAREIAGDNV